MKKLLLACMAITLFAAPAHALFELRAGYGITTPAEGTQSGNEVKTMDGFNLDAIAEIPLFPLGLGLRYESMGFTLNNGTDLDSKFTRVSALVNYRIIDLFAYFGLIGTVGLSNKLAIEVPGFADAEYDASLTYSVGAEAGVSLGLITVGGELGYFVGNMEQTNNPSNPDIDLGGVYAKAIVGIGF